MNFHHMKPLLAPQTRWRWERGHGEYKQKFFTPRNCTEIHKIQLNTKKLVTTKLMDITIEQFPSIDTNNIVVSDIWGKGLGTGFQFFKHRIE